MNEEPRRVPRPWEDPTVESPEPDDSSEDPPDGAEGDDQGTAEATDEVDLTDWEAMARPDSDPEGLSEQSYVGATTEEYRDLAQEIARLKGEQFERQAVSATMAGLDSGLVGFEDVTGRRGVSEEEVEAAEQARSSDLTVRIASALGLLALFLGSLYLGGWWFIAFLTLVMLVSLGEFYATVRRVGYAPLALVGLLGVIAMPVLAHSSTVFAIAGVSVTATLLAVLVFTLVSRRHPLENVSMTVFGMCWVGLLAFVVPIVESPHPFAYILMIALTTGLVDIGSYFVGRGFGSRALAPTLSPNKTVEGFVGGLVTAIVTVGVLSTLPPYADLGFTGAIIFGLIVGLVAPVGDLAESMVKRSLGVKDMGSVLPGHGGMLDRIDGFLFVVPAAYVFLMVRDLL